MYSIQMKPVVIIYIYIFILIIIIIILFSVILILKYKYIQHTHLQKNCTAVVSSAKPPVSLFKPVRHPADFPKIARKSS